MSSSTQPEETPSPGLEFQKRLSHRHVSQNAPYVKWLKMENLKLFRQTFNKFLDVFEKVVQLQKYEDAVEIFNNLVKLVSYFILSDRNCFLTQIFIFLFSYIVLICDHVWIQNYKVYIYSFGKYREFERLQDSVLSQQNSLSKNISDRSCRKDIRSQG